MKFLISRTFKIILTILSFNYEVLSAEKQTLLSENFPTMWPTFLTFPTGSTKTEKTLWPTLWSENFPTMWPTFLTFPTGSTTEKTLWPTLRSENFPTMWPTWPTLENKTT